VNRDGRFSAIWGSETLERTEFKFAYDLPLLKQRFVPRCVAAAAAEEPAATEAPAVIQDETSEPRSESEGDSDVDDEQDETATDAAAADEATSHVELSTGKPLHPLHFKQVSLLFPVIVESSVTEMSEL